MLTHRNGDESFSSEIEKKRETKRGKNENYRVVAFIVFGLRFVPSYLIIFSFFSGYHLLGLNYYPSKMHTLRS